MPPLTMIRAGPDCEEKDDQRWHARYQYGCTEVVQLPGESFDIKCVAKGHGLDEVKLEKFK